MTPQRGKAEPIWDSLIPSMVPTAQSDLRTDQPVDGLGYVKDTPLSGLNLSVISAFHQLHCLVSNPIISSNPRGSDIEHNSIPSEEPIFQLQQAVKISILNSIVATILPIALSICAKASCALLTRLLNPRRTPKRAFWVGVSRDSVGIMMH